MPRISAEVTAERHDGAKVPSDEIATAIARCAGALAESGRAEPYGSSSKIFFEC